MVIFQKNENEVRQRAATEQRNVCSFAQTTRLEACSVPALITLNSGVLVYTISDVELAKTAGSPQGSAQGSFLRVSAKRHTSKNADSGTAHTFLRNILTRRKYTATMMISAHCCPNV